MTGSYSCFESCVYKSFNPPSTPRIIFYCRKKETKFCKANIVADIYNQGNLDHKATDMSKVKYCIRKSRYKKRQAEFRGSLKLSGVRGIYLSLNMKLEQDKSKCKGIRRKVKALFKATL